MKSCTKCGELKPYDAYYAVNGPRDGLRGNCIECHREQVKARLDNEIIVGPFLAPDPTLRALHRILYEEEAWKEQAACADDTQVAGSYDAYFDHDQWDVAKRDKCLHCPVAFECLEYSVRIDAVDGVWGGMSGEPRRRFINSVDMKSPRARAKHAAILDELRLRGEKVG